MAMLEPAERLPPLLKSGFNLSDKDEPFGKVHSDPEAVNIITAKYAAAFVGLFLFSGCALLRPTDIIPAQFDAETATEQSWSVDRHKKEILFDAKRICWHQTGRHLDSGKTNWGRGGSATHTSTRCIDPLVRAFTHAGDHQTAEDLVRLVPNAIGRNNLIGRIGHSYAISGNLVDANRMKDLLPKESRARHRIDAGIATHFARMGLTDEAYEALQTDQVGSESSGTGPVSKSKQIVARGLAEGGHFDDAIAVAKQIQKVRTRRYLLTDVAHALLDFGDRRHGLWTVNNIHRLAPDVSIFPKVPDSASQITLPPFALKIPELAETAALQYRDFILFVRVPPLETLTEDFAIQLTDLLVAFGYKDDAVRVLESRLRATTSIPQAFTAPPPWPRRFLRPAPGAKLFAQLSRFSSPEHAVKFLIELDDSPFWRDTAYAYKAGAMANEGRLEDAVRLADRLEAFNRETAYALIARAYASEGNYDLTAALIEMIDGEDCAKFSCRSRREQAWRPVAMVAADRGDYDKALSWAGKISGKVGAKTEAEIAVVMASQGDLIGAWHVARTISDHLLVEPTMTRIATVASSP